MLLPKIKLSNIEAGARVAVAMSGGVDSSVVAALMHHSGYEVVGITMQLYDQGFIAQRKGACCAGQDIYDARNVADHLGFAHYVLDYENVFKQNVIDNFIDVYLQGETPSPCIRCNQRVKFVDLLKKAQQLEAKAMVTGHYARRIMVEDKISQLHKAIDPAKDQSYFLFAITKSQLDFVHFPLGDFTKQQTRAMASFLNLPVAEKPDSQDICFVPNGNYAKVVEKFRPGSLEAGEIVDMQGNVLGLHDGIINFTVGQRKGLKISAAEPLYVVAVDAQTKRVTVGPKTALATKIIKLKEVNWLVDSQLFSAPKTCMVKIRSNHNPVKSTVQMLSENVCEVILEEAEYGVALGQACVFYDQNQLLGGGWISK